MGVILLVLRTSVLSLEFNVGLSSGAPNCQSNLCFQYPFCTAVQYNDDLAYVVCFFVCMHHISVHLGNNGCVKFWS